MTEPQEDPAERARRYISSFQKVLGGSAILKEVNSIDSGVITKVTDTINRYLEDARYYLENNKPSTSLASIAYAEGLLDALIFLGLAKQDRTSTGSP